MKPQILSLNIGVPQVIEWDGKSIETSMLKTPVKELKVGPLSIDGDRFANPEFHGTPDSVLYVYGRRSMQPYLEKLGRESLAHGELGENITVDDFDENEVSVGDRFQIGDVIAEATFPRVPCSKLNFRMQHPLGQKAMIEVLRSGVYFRIITPGTIRMDSEFARVSRSATPFTIGEVYKLVVGGVKITRDLYDRAVANGAFPQERLAKWARLF